MGETFLVEVYTESPRSSYIAKQSLKVLRWRVFLRYSRIFIGEVVDSLSKCAENTFSTISRIF
jgi:hypothetical protein